VTVGTFTITDAGTITDLNMRLTFNGTSNALEFLTVALLSPTGTSVNLFSGPQLLGALFQTILDDEATSFVNIGSSPYLGAYKPMSSFTAFDGESITGDWSLVVNNTQGNSGAFDWNILLPIDFIPNPPQNLSAMPGDQQITLSWSANTDSDLTKYRIYQGNSSPASTLLDSVVGTPPDTTYLESGLTNGQNRYYRITAVDTAGNESGFSDEARAVPGLLPISVSPAQNALNVPLGATVSVTFGDDMNPATINANTFVVHGGYTGKLSGAYGYDSGTRTATFISSQPFKVGEQLSVTLTTGVASTAGDTLVAPYVWDFTAEVLGGEWGVRTW